MDSASKVTANSFKTMLRRRIKTLAQAQAKFNEGSDAKDILLRDFVEICQKLEDEYDQLKTENDAALLDQKRTVDALEEKNSRLQGIISSMHSQEEGSLDDPNSDHQTKVTLLPAVKEQKDLKSRLEDALRSKRVLAKGLADAQRHSVYYEGRVRQLNWALEQSPNAVANVSGVVELKDRMYSDLERRAGECFTTFIALNESSNRDRQLAEKEIVSLKANLDHSRTRISVLENSKSTLQCYWEDVRRMLQKRVLQTDFNKAMNAYYQLAIDDNSFLKAEVELQASQISCKDLRIMSLEEKVYNIEKSLQDKEKTNAALHGAICSKDREIWALQVHVDAIKLDYQDACIAKDDQIADLSEKLQSGFNTTLDMVEASKDERERAFIRSREEKIKALEEKCEDLEANVDDLYKQLDLNEEVFLGNIELACTYQATARDYKTRLAAAEKEIHDLQKRLREALTKKGRKKGKGKGKEREDTPQRRDLSPEPRARSWHGSESDSHLDDGRELQDSPQLSESVFKRGVAEVEAKYGIRLTKDAEGKTHVEVLQKPECSAGGNKTC